jgi:hypothetical protein
MERRKIGALKTLPELPEMAEFHNGRSPLTRQAAQ